MTETTKNSKYPFISVIVPVFNGRKRLPFLFQSLREQDYTGGFEVIIADDGSTDGSADYAESQGYRTVRQQNMGPGIARNNGASIAKGEYLVFTDDDCVLDKDFLTEMVKPLIGMDYVGSQGQIYSLQKSPVARFIHFEHTERYDLLEKAEYTDWVATYAACYRKDIFLEAGGFCDIYSSEDCELSFRLARDGYKMVFAPKARSQHQHFTNFFKYIRYKYKRAYWSIWLYNLFPKRAVHDPLTPISRKLMMLFLGLTFIGIISIPFLSIGKYLALFSYIIWLGLTMPLTDKIFRKDRLLGVLTPLFLLTRTLSYIAGVIKGYYDFKRGVRGAKRSASK